MMPVIPLTVRISALFWKLSSFLITPEPRTAMTVHSTSFPNDKPVLPAAPAEAFLPAAAAAPQAVAAKKLNLRKLLLTGAAIAALAGAGLEWWGVHARP